MKRYLKNFFIDFSDDMIEKLKNISKLVIFPKDKILFYEGDNARNLYLLVEGEVSVYKTYENGSVQLLRYFKPLSLVAELVNIHKIPYPATGKCEEESRIIIIDFNRFQTLFNNKDEFVLSQSILMNSIAGKLFYHMNFNSFRPTKKLSNLQQVIYLILDDIDILNKKKHWKVAQTLNISPESLSRAIKKLKENNLIDIDENNNLYIINKDKMKTFIE